MKVEVEIDETKLACMCKREDVQEVYRLIGEISGTVWCEANYDAYNNASQKLARDLEPKIDRLKVLLRVPSK